MHPAVITALGNDYQYNVLNYGATGDGVTDDTAAIQAAITAAGRGTVFLPEGNYRVTQLNITTSTNMLGCGAGGVVTGGTRITSISALPVINISYVNDYAHTFQNFAIIGNDTAGQIGFLINGMSSNLTLFNVYVLNCDYGVQMATVRHTTGINFISSTFQNNVTAGIYGLNNNTDGRQVNAINIISCQIGANGHGIHIMGTNINIIANTIQGQSKTGIFLSSRVLGNKNSQSNNVNIHDNYMEENVEASIIGEAYYTAAPAVVQAISYLTIRGNYIYQTDATTTENAAIILRRAAGSLDFLTGVMNTQILKNNISVDGALYKIDANDCLNNTSTLYVDGCETVDFLTLYTGLWETQFQRPEIIGRINVPGYKAIGHIPVTGITAAQLAPVMLIAQTAAIDITSNPQIAAGFYGQEIMIIGNSDANTLTLDDGNGLQLAGGASMVLGLNDVIVLKYNTWSAVWFEISRSDN